ncbi:hypothetical protein [Paenibacillus sp. LPE1-1-1.1]
MQSMISKMGRRWGGWNWRYFYSGDGYISFFFADEQVETEPIGTA